MIEVQYQQEEQIDDFFSKFVTFYQTVENVTNVRFSYMKELFNLGVEAFPENYEIFSIQQNNRLSGQSSLTKPKKNWSEDDKKVLIWLVGKMMAQNKRDLKQISESDWTTIASMMQRRDPFQCKQKWLQMMKMPLQQAPWTLAEDQLLQQIIEDFQRQNKGNKWSQIATTLNRMSDAMVHRNGKQCRERWNNHLNPAINRNPWQLTEDLDLMRLALHNGKKWALISKKLQVPRSENSVKNRFNCLLRKEKNQKLNKREEYSDVYDDSKSSDFPSTDELSTSEIRQIQLIIKKLEWRIQQDGSQKSPEESAPQPVKQEQQLEKKVKVEQFPRSEIKAPNEFHQCLVRSQDSVAPVSLQIKDSSHLQKEDWPQLLPALLNREKNILFLVSPEQFQNQIFRNNNENVPQQQNPQMNELMSMQSNSHQQLMFDQKFFRSIMAYQQSYQDFQNMQYNLQTLQTQRSVLNLPQNTSSFQQYPSYQLPGNYPSNQNLSLYQQYQNMFMNQGGIDNRQI